MAYRELPMIEVREVLRRFILGDGVRAIARGTGVDRKTAVKYVCADQGVGLLPGGPLPTDDEVHRVTMEIQPPAPQRATPPATRGPGSLQGSAPT
jgi:hypothetical protein